MKLIDIQKINEGQKVRIIMNSNTMYEGIYRGTKKMNGSINFVLDNHKVYRKTRSKDYSWFDKGYRCSLDIIRIKSYEIVEDDVKKDEDIKENVEDIKGNIINPNGNDSS